MAAIAAPKERKPNGVVKPAQSEVIQAPTTIIRRMQIRFTKMQGAGNDFVVLDETQGRLGLSTAQYRFLADRRPPAHAMFSQGPSHDQAADANLDLGQ